MWTTQTPDKQVVDNYCDRKQRGCICQKNSEQLTHSGGPVQGQFRCLPNLFLQAQCAVSLSTSQSPISISGCTHNSKCYQHCESSFKRICSYWKGEKITLSSVPATASVSPPPCQTIVCLDKSLLHLGRIYHKEKSSGIVEEKRDRKKQILSMKSYLRSYKTAKLRQSYI